MSIPELERAGTADRLDILVAQGRYAEAQECFDAYCRDFKDTLRSLPPDDPRLRQMETEWRRLLEQTRRRVLTGRAHAAARLARLPGHRRFYRSAPSPRRTWEVLG
jgi:hypothetical protein